MSKYIPYIKKLTFSNNIIDNDFDIIGSGYENQPLFNLGYHYYTKQVREKMNDDELALCVKLKGIVTYASATDSFTESRSEATPADVERHASSGMPKRPSVSQAFQSGLVLFDKEDLEDRGAIGELVIDNWTWDTVYVMASVFPHHFIRSLKKLCKENGINLVQV